MFVYHCPEAVIEEDEHPAPLWFPDKDSKKVVSKKECRRHYIEFLKYGDSGTKTWICGVCGQRNSQQFSLMRHLMMDHLGMRVYKCQHCPKTFKTAAVLAQHRKSAHSATKAYVCDVCEKQFGRVSVLIQHRRIHSDVKEHTCHCGKAFHQKVNLTMHQLRLHPPAALRTPKPVHCPPKPASRPPKPANCPSKPASRPSKPANGPPKPANRPPKPVRGGSQRTLQYSCVVCSAQFESVPELLQHKLTCQPLLQSLRTTVKVNRDTEQRIGAGKERNMNNKLLNKIQDIVHQQERLRRRETAALPRLDPCRLRRLYDRPAPSSCPPAQPRRPETAPETQQQTDDTPAGKIMGVLTAPIRTQSMLLARQRGLQPFVVLQSDTDEPTLAKVLPAANNLELLVPATIEDLYQMSQQQDGDSDKVDVTVVAMVTQIYDENGAPHVRVQPPSSERAGGTVLATSQVDLGPARAASPLTLPASPDADDPPSPAAVVDSPQRDQPSPVADDGGPSGTVLSMPSGAQLLLLDTAAPASPTGEPESPTGQDTASPAGLSTISPAGASAASPAVASTSPADLAPGSERSERQRSPRPAQQPPADEGAEAVTEEAPTESPLLFSLLGRGLWSSLSV
ncbi:zinc finger protein 628-like isoform X2 [Amphibalanus amphitrite]|uniref:zinc finger protein 628-like isoform X2 n=1 Tax=Amphibalanus amphitrite TaxID=1232801 RepID=UPI001C90C61D|nr:zinc finger protein 628-like isoform X2 [Amphibalanus amphitrite]